MNRNFWSPLVEAARDFGTGIGCMQLTDPARLNIYMCGDYYVRIVAPDLTFTIFERRYRLPDAPPFDRYRNDIIQVFCLKDLERVCVVLPHHHCYYEVDAIRQ